MTRSAADIFAAIASASAPLTLARAAEREQAEARHMNRALWPATMGYFLTQMMGAPLTPDDCAWGRAHFIDHVRAAGPLPALRIGRQPYGVLPVTSLGIWKPKAGEEAQSTRDVALRDILLKLRAVWQGNLPQVPRVGRSGNPDQDVEDEPDRAKDPVRRVPGRLGQRLVPGIRC